MTRLASRMGLVGFQTRSQHAIAKRGHRVCVDVKRRRHVLDRVTELMANIDTNYSIHGGECVACEFINS
jgi:hypothetical protein